MYSPVSTQKKSSKQDARSNSLVDRHPQTQRTSSQLGLGLRLLQDRLHLGRLHDVAADLELAGHEQALGVGLAGDQGAEVLVGEQEGNCAENKSG